MDNIRVGDPIKADWLNELNNAATKLTNLKVGSGLTATNLPSGLYLALSFPYIPCWLGIVTDKGSCSNKTGSAVTTTASDYSDERYFVERCYVDNDEEDDNCAAVVYSKYTSPDPRYQIVTATNINEAGAHSHTVAKDTPVIVFEQWDTGNPPKKRYYISAGGGGIGTPEFQGMFYGGVAQNIGAYSYIFFHELV